MAIFHICGSYPASRHKLLFFFRVLLALAPLPLAYFAGRALPPQVTAAVLLALLAVFVWYSSGLVSGRIAAAELRWFRGKSGEDRTAAALRRLPDTWHVFSNFRLPGGRWDIDFLLCGPAGLVALEVKNFRGFRSWRIPTATAQAGRQIYSLKQYLSSYGQPPFVRSVIVIAGKGPASFPSSSKPALVPVDLLYDWLLGLPPDGGRALGFLSALRRAQ